MTDVNTKGNRTLLKADHARKWPACNVVEASASAGGNMAHFVSKAPLCDEGSGVPTTHHGVAFGFSTSIEHLDGS